MNENSAFSAPPRINTLNRQIIKAAERRKLKVKLFSDKQVKQVFFADGKGTKHATAELLAQRFPIELGFRLPPKRRSYDSEDSRMDVFEAVAIGAAYFYTFYS